MAIGTEIICSLAAEKISRPFAVNPGLPVPIDIAVAFAAEPVAFSKLDELSVE